MSKWESKVWFKIYKILIIYNRPETHPLNHKKYRKSLKNPPLIYDRNICQICGGRALFLDWTKYICALYQVRAGQNQWLHHL